MSKGTAGYDYTMTFDDGGGHQTLGHVTLDFNPSFESDDTTESGQSAEDTTLTLARYTISGESIYEEAADDVPKGDFITAYFAKTEIEVILYPSGNSSGNRKFTFTGMLITSMSFPSGGVAGTVRTPFTLRNSDGLVVTIGAVA